MPHSRRRPVTRAALAASAALVVLLAGCGSSDDTSGGGTTMSATSTTTAAGRAATIADLDGTSFAATSVTGHDALVPDSDVTFAVVDGRVVANAGCNTISAAGTLTDGVLGGFETAIQTNMACDEALMAQEQWLVNLLQSGPTVLLDGETLTISKDGVTLVMKKDSDTAKALTGTVWELESYAKADAAKTEVPDGVTSTLELGEPADGKSEAKIAFGCNTGGGMATITEDSITFGPLRSTKMACDEDKTKVENAVSSTLEGESTYILEDDTLTLTSDRGTLVYDAK